MDNEWSDMFCIYTMEFFFAKHVKVYQTLRIQVCLKKGITPTFLFFG